MDLHDIFLNEPKKKRNTEKSAQITMRIINSHYFTTTPMLRQLYIHMPLHNARLPFSPLTLVLVAKDPSRLSVCRRLSPALSVHDLPNSRTSLCATNFQRGQDVVERNIARRRIRPDLDNSARGDGVADLVLAGGRVCGLPFGPETIELGVEDVEERVGGGGVHVGHLTAHNSVAAGVQAEERERVRWIKIALNLGRKLLEGLFGEDKVDLGRGQPEVGESLAEVAEDAAVILGGGEAALLDVNALVLEEAGVDAVALARLE